MFVLKNYDRQNHVWSFMTKYLRFLCKFTSWSCGCIQKQIRCWKNCWYSYNIDKCNTMLCLSSRNMIDKTMCEVFWRNISDFYVNLRVEVEKHPHVNLPMCLFILDKNNERPNWMTDLKHTDFAWFSKVTQVNSL